MGEWYDMKKIIFYLCLLFIIFNGSNQCIFAASNSGKCGENVNWYYNLETKELLIQGKGATYNYSTNHEAGEYTLDEWNSFEPDVDDYKFHNGAVKPRPWHDCDIKKIVIKEGITEIKACTFHGMDNLEEVELPSTLKIIGNSAFGATGLKRINIPDSVLGIKGMAFLGCSNLKTVRIGKNVEKIGESAFDSSGLTKLVLYDKIQQIDNEAFSGCTNLTEVDLKRCVKLIRIEPSVFNYCVKLKSTR